MTAPVSAGRGERFPGLTLPDIDGAPVFLESYRGRTNLVVVFAGGRPVEGPVAMILEELLARTEALTSEAAQVLVVALTSQSAAVSQRGPWPFPVLVDEGAQIHREVGATDAAGRPAPAVFITDRFREIYAAYLPMHGLGLPGAKEILDWLVFINLQCPECGVPEWPTG